MFCYYQFQNKPESAVSLVSTHSRINYSLCGASVYVYFHMSLAYGKYQILTVNLFLALAALKPYWFFCVAKKIALI